VRERHNGIYQGKTTSCRDQAVEASGIEDFLFKPKGGESKFDIFKRASAFIDEELTKN
jgi:hypothetical protein